MLRLFVPFVFILAGLGAGVGGGLMLRPDPETALQTSAHCEPTKNPDPDRMVPGQKDVDTDNPKDREYVKLNNQFVVPVVSGDLVEALVVMSLSVEIAQGKREYLYAHEPRLRDALLQAMFDHANMGGFDGAFTDANTLDVLRVSLTETARGVIGPDVSRVLIVDLARQDV